jgi:eukaryotic translation initiation factor 2C
MVKERLTAWATSHSGILPENMVFYRDGISESQFHECERGEIAAIRTAYASLCVGKNENARLKLTFVVVGKRHNTRFYPTNTSDCTKYEKYDEKKSNMNVAPGLLVDRVITDPKRVNFYLQSHQAIKGTARAAHYHVLVDDIGFKENNKAVGSLSDLTHQLCYAFSRATRGVSYVAPAYIADRLCERGRVYLRDWSGEGLPEFKTGGKKGKSTVEELKKWKDVCAKKAMRDVRFQGGTEKLWGHYNDDATKGVVRLNPWHPEMDRVMFWM